MPGVLGQGVRVVALDQGERGRARQWASAIGALLADEGAREAAPGAGAAPAVGSAIGAVPAAHAVLKREGHAVVLRTSLCGLDVVVKVIPLTAAFDRLKAAVGAGRGARHWRAAWRLGAAGERTARPLALARAWRPGRPGPIPCEILVIERLAGRSVLEHLGGRDLSGAQERALARALGAQIGRLARHGLFNRDHKPSNLIVTDADPRGPEVAIIDCVGLRAAWRAGGAWRRTGVRGLPGHRKRAAERMLASLWIEPSGTGCAPRGALVAACVGGCAQEFDLSRVARHELWRCAAGIVRAHGDPTPRVRPLAQAGRPE